MHTKTNRQLQAKIRARKARRQTIALTGGVRAYVAMITIVGLLFTMLPEAFAASSWNPTLLVNTESFQTIDDDDVASNLELRFGDTLQEKIMYDRSNQRFKFSRSVFVSGNGVFTGSLLVNIGASTAGADTALEVIGVASGTTVYATRSFSGAGLTDCDTAGTSKLLWDATTGRFSCGSDQTGGGTSNWSNTGSLQGYFDNRFVNQSGDGMTGALAIANGNPKPTAENGVLLDVMGAVSGNTLRVSGNTTIHGALSATGQIITDGDLTLNDDRTSGADTTLTFGNVTANQTLKYLNTLQKFQFSTNVSVIGNLSGSSLTIDRNGTFSGNVLVKGNDTVKGTISGTTINANGLLTGTTVQGFGLYGCTGASNKLTYNATTKKFLCEADQTGGGSSGGGGMAFSTAENIYVNQAGDTMTGALQIRPTAGPLTFGLQVAAAMSGRSLAITGTGSKPLFYTDVTRGTIGINTATPDKALTISGGTLLTTAGGTAQVMSGVDLGATVNAVYVSGNYAYVATDSNGSNAELRSIDISDPRAPSIVGGFDTAQNASALFISTRYAFVGLSGAAAGSGLLILDNTNPALQRYAGRVNFGSAVRSIYVSGKYAYVGLSNKASTICLPKSRIFSGCDFVIVDFTNPNVPIIVSGLKFSSDVNAIYVQNRFAYVGLTSVGGNDLQIVDLTNPASPVTVGGSDFTNSVLSLYVTGKYVFAGLAADVSNPEFRVIDTTNKTSPTQVGSLEVGAAVESTFVLGDWGRIGLSSSAGDDYWTLDLRSTISPKKVGGIDMGADVNALFIAGKYSYAGLSSVAGNDLRIMDLDGIETPAISVGTMAAASLSVADNARFDNNLYVRNALNVGRGGIISKGGLSIQSTGSGITQSSTGTLSSGFGGLVGTGNTLNAFEVRNGTGKHLMSISDNGMLQAGIPSTSTGTMQIMPAPVWGRQPAWATIVLPASATALTAVSMTTPTVTAAGVNAIQHNRSYIRYTAVATSGNGNGIVGPYTQTRPGFRPRFQAHFKTGTGVVSMRFWGGLSESTLVGLAPSLVDATTTIDYVGIGWDSSVNGSKWMCCSGDGARHNCVDMGAGAPQPNTEYAIDVDWSQAGRLTCRLKAPTGVIYSVFKDAKLSKNAVNMGPQLSITTQQTGGTNICRSFMINSIYLEQY